MTAAVPKLVSAPSRMSLASIQRGRTRAPLRVLLHGVPGVGKTTFAAGAPSAVFLGREDGGGLLDLARFPRPETWGDVLQAVRQLAEEKHEFKTLVIDTLDSLEPLCWRAVCERDGKLGIEEVGGGYGKGYIAAVDEWRVFIAALERLRDVGMHVVLLAHTTVKNFKNPEGPDYDRYIMKLHEKAGGVFVEWCDTVLFAQFEHYVSVEKKGAKGKAKQSNDVRVAYARRHAAYDAKNRHALPETLPLSWEDFWTAVNAAPDPDKLFTEALKLAATFEGELAKKMSDTIHGAVGNATKLAEILNRINARLAAKAEEENANGNS